MVIAHKKPRVDRTKSCTQIIHSILSQSPIVSWSSRKSWPSEDWIPAFRRRLMAIARQDAGMTPRRFSCVRFTKSIALLFLLVTTSTLSAGFNPKWYACSYRCPSPGATPPGKVLFNVGQDMVGINLNIISFSTFKIVVCMFPFVLVGRMVDGRLQSCFYDRVHHKNIYQLDDACRMFAKHSLVFPCCLAAALSFGARDEDVKETSRMFIKGLPFVLLMSNLIKKIDVHIVGEGCLRPWNEHFSREKRARGGWPSGHLASVSYAAALYGHRFGPKWAVPLGALTAAVGISFLNCNRHYISQILAGVGLGAIYGVAASKQVDFRLSKKYDAFLQANLDVDQQGCPAMKVGVTF